ncbi:Hypothetical protein R9X50_00389800 [Acrodontium crateriforme]|uniref:Rad4-domain-containing protein n=1 Tax=Acrodontium crateriforme TaxID=150365 RepID=A0AAQ3RC93_9PEZI|nr:Hypothetical protein R9X50_00389800 [Acrodontium crateriforme]
MAPSRGKRKSHAPPARARLATLRSTRRSAPNLIRNRDVDDIYQEMLEEVNETQMERPIVEERPLKRRRVAPKNTEEVAHSELKLARLDDNDDDDEDEDDEGELQTLAYPQATPTIGQLSEGNSDSDDDDDELDFEDVDLDATGQPALMAGGEDDIGDVSVAIEPNVDPKKTVVAKRPPASRAEKARRLLIHKFHLFFLIGSCRFINSRCNNETVKLHLKGLLSERIVGFLNPSPNDSQFGRDRAFKDGLRQAVETFRDAFSINAPGMRKARWMTDEELEEINMSEEPGSMDLSDFIRAAKKMEGSQDTGNQLFCALLRSIGVKTRLVCSLQTLPLSNIAPRQRSPGKTTSTVVYTMPTTPSPGPSAGRRRLGQPGFARTVVASPAKAARKIRKLEHPVFWVEAFNRAYQRWIAVDPLVTGKVNLPARLEPPASSQLNQLTYALAFEESGVVKDVTRRYARSFNAKTRRQRIEGMEPNSDWLDRALSPLRRHGRPLNRDQIEDAELAEKSGREGMPSNLQDFKDHPVYALERHLRRNEVIYPKHETGRTNAGTNVRPVMEPVFRRRDVLLCRSAQKWKLLGRQVKTGEHPLKHVTARTKRDVEEEDEGALNTSLYAEFQTEVYVAPSVVNGRVPRNHFGNIEIFVPSMVPKGGEYIRGQLASQAARTLRIDFAEAIVGFDFKNRRGTPRIDGIVVATEHADAVRAAIEGIIEDKTEDESAARSLIALKAWKKFLTVMQVAERIQSYGEGAMVAEGRKLQNESSKANDELHNGGGFIPDEKENDDKPLLNAGKFSIKELRRKIRTGQTAKRKARDETPEDDLDIHDDTPEEEIATDETTHQTTASMQGEEEDDDGGGGGFVVDPIEIDRDDIGGGFIPDTANDHDLAEEGGGFIPDTTHASESERGGFIPENSPEQETKPSTTLAPPNEHTPQEAKSENLHIQNQMDVEPSPPKESSNSSSFENDKDSSLSNTNTTARVSHQPSKMAVPEKVDEEEEDEEDEKENESSDCGSLLSHDPEDEDAEPDWLESD